VNTRRAGGVSPLMYSVSCNQGADAPPLAGTVRSKVAEHPKFDGTTRGFFASEIIGELYRACTRLLAVRWRLVVVYPYLSDHPRLAPHRPCSCRPFAVVRDYGSRPEEPPSFSHSRNRARRTQRSSVRDDLRGNCLAQAVGPLPVGAHCPWPSRVAIGPISSSNAA
jgi:hypothetical protein